MLNITETEFLTAKLDRIMSHTQGKQVIRGLSSRTGIYDLGDGKALVASAGSVRSKIKLAYVLNKHDSIGIDCVAMCVNDVASFGAKPLFFENYLTMGKMYSDKVTAITLGMAEGCAMANCAFIGSENVEVNGIMKSDEYHLAGFAVGIADKDKLILGPRAMVGDVLVGIAASGIHYGDFKLIRRLFTYDSVALSHYVDALKCSLGEELLKPALIYSNCLLQLNDLFDLHAVIHIMDDGLIGGIEQLLQKGMSAKLYPGAWPILPVYNLLAMSNKSSLEELLDEFNMGLGMILAVKRDYGNSVVKAIEGMGHKAYIVGEVTTGNREICFSND